MNTIQADDDNLKTIWLFTCKLHSPHERIWSLLKQPTQTIACVHGKKTTFGSVILHFKHITLSVRARFAGCDVNEFCEIEEEPIDSSSLSSFEAGRFDG